MTERPYSRVYWSILDDPKFDGIRDNAAHLGTWTLLLVVADMAYPSPAFLPPARRPSVDALVSAGLVDLLSGGRFRVRGLEAERIRRSEAARAAGRASGNARRTTVEQSLNGRSLHPRTESNLVLDEYKTSTSRDEATVRDAAVALYERTGRYPSKGLLDWIARLESAHSAERVTAAIDAAIVINLDGPGAYLKAAEDVLRREDHRAQQAEVHAERERAKANRAQPQAVSPVVAQLRDALRSKEGGTAA